MDDNNIRDNISTFYDPISMPGGWTFDHVKQLETNYLYYNGKYKTGQYDSRGNRKFFFNIIKPACDIATKFIDLDTKDIITSPLRSGDEMPVFFMQRRLKQYLIENNFGDLLNEIGEEFPKGHVVLKKAKNKFSLVNLMNLRSDTTVQYLKKSPYVYELHRMTIDEMQDEGWDTKELEERHPRETVFDIYECYIRKKGGWYRTIKGDMYSKATKSGYKAGTEQKITARDEFAKGVTLKEEEKVEFPYRELKWEDVKGRWLGHGFIELLEDNQVSTNEAENLERKALYFTALKLYQTQDESIGGSNVLSNAENGDILKVSREITPLQNEERNLAAFNSTRNRTDANTQAKTFTYDISSGQNLPSRTPLGVANLSASMVTSFFDGKREKFGEFVKRLLLDDIIPAFKKDTAKAHEMMFSGSDDEIERLDNFIADMLVDRATLDRATQTGFFPSQPVKDDARDRVKKQLKKQVNRYLKIMDKYFENVKFILDINITGESFDLGKHNEAMNFALQTLATNPAILQNRTTRSIFFEFMSQNGFSPVKLNMLSQDIDMTPVPTAGSLAGSSPQPGMAQTAQMV